MAAVAGQGAVRWRVRTGEAPQQGKGGSVAHAPTGAPLPGDHSSGGYRSSAGSRNAEIVEGGTSGRLGGTEKILEDRVRFCIIGGRISPTAFCISEVLNEVVKGTSD